MAKFVISNEGRGSSRGPSPSGGPGSEPDDEDHLDFALSRHKFDLYDSGPYKRVYKRSSPSGSHEVHVFTGPSEGKSSHFHNGKEIATDIHPRDLKKHLDNYYGV